MRFALFISFLLFGAVKAAYIDVDENLNITELSVCSDSSSVLNFPSIKEELIQFVEYCSLAYCMPKNKITDGNLLMPVQYPLVQIALEIKKLFISLKEIFPA